MSLWLKDAGQLVSLKKISMIIKKESMGNEVQVEHNTWYYGKPCLQEEYSQLQCGDKYHLLWSVSSIIFFSPLGKKSIPP